MLTPRPTFTPVRVSAEAHVNRGRTLVSRGRIEPAIQAFNEAIEANAGYADAYHNRALAYLAMDQAERAISDLDEAIRLDPESVESYNARGAAFASMGRYGPAIEDYDHVIRLDPESGSAYFNRAQVHLLSGEPEQAVTDLGEVVAMYPKSADAYGWRGLAYLEADQPQNAVNDLSKAIELEPTVGEYYAHRARAFAILGLSERAQRDMGAVAELGLDPDFVTAALESNKAFESSFSVSSADPVPPPLPTLASATNEIPTDLDGTWRGATTLAGTIELTIQDNQVQSVTLEECFGVVSHSFPYSPPRDMITAGAFSLTEDPFTLRGEFSSENRVSGLVEFASVPPCGSVRSVPWDAVKLPAAGPGEWSSAGDTAEARASHTATRLQDGTVLVAGGRSEDDRILATAEVYEPIDGAWSTTGSMEHPRVSHVAVPLRNGSVLAIGGTSDSGEPLASAEIYDPSTGIWISAGAMAQARHFHTATLLGDGRVLVTGGLNEDNDVLASTELFDPVENVWSTAPDLPTPRFSHTSVLLSDGRVLSVGGVDASFQLIPSADVYDPSTSEWSSPATRDSLVSRTRLLRSATGGRWLPVAFTPLWGRLTRRRSTARSWEHGSAWLPSPSDAGTTRQRSWATARCWSSEASRPA